MTAWVKFINHTEFDVIYLEIDETRVPFLLPKDTESKYILSPAGNVTFNYYDNRGHKRKTGNLTIIPSKLQTVLVV